MANDVSVHLGKFISHLNNLDKTRRKMEALLKRGVIVRRDIEQVYDLYKLPQKQEPRYKKRRANDLSTILPAHAAFGNVFSREAGLFGHPAGCPP